MNAIIRSRVMYNSSVVESLCRRQFGKIPEALANPINERLAIPEQNTASGYYNDQEGGNRPSFLNSHLVKPDNRYSLSGQNVQLWLSNLCFIFYNNNITYNHNHTNDMCRGVNQHHQAPPKTQTLDQGQVSLYLSTKLLSMLVIQECTCLAWVHEVRSTKTAEIALEVSSANKIRFASTCERQTKLRSKVQHSNGHLGKMLPR